MILIEKDKAVEETWQMPSYSDPLNVLTEVRDRIKALPTIEIVRCKDCKWWEKKEDSTLGYCNAVKHWHFSDHLEIQIYSRYEPDFFCADGERRSEDE